MSEHKVVSKYFSTETVMDESLSDFKEKKKCNTGPRNIKKTTNNKKQVKRAKGQKDIRALIKKKENEVVSFSKDFDKVCKQTGVDVDSEQLQLAIALSKSLHEVQSSSDSETKSTESLTSLQRTLKIKTTLQEYGFKTTQKGIPPKINRKRGLKKQYKLLLISETERQQNISDKYSEVLAANLFRSPVKVSEQYYTKGLYYKTTNITYDHIKNDEIYYVQDLFVKSCNNFCLLRDWSKIPGRPLSPIVEINNINFDDIICNEDELDCVLSGTIFTAQQIVSKKSTEIDVKSANKIVQLGHDEHRSIVNKVTYIDHDVKNFKSITESEILLQTDCNTRTMALSQQDRCISPDIFDDEVCSIINCTRNGKQFLEQTVLKSDNNVSYCMDLTKCVDIEPYNADKHIKTNTANNLTNKTSNDYMEITECVSTSSKPVNFENIDLIPSLNGSNKKSTNIHSQILSTDVMDLTQVPDDGLLAQVNSKKTDYCQDDIIVVLEDGFNLRHSQEKESYLKEPIDDPNSDKKNTKAYVSIDKGNSDSHEKIEIIVLDEQTNFNMSSKENFNLADHTCPMYTESPNKLQGNSTAKNENVLSQLSPTNSFTDHIFENYEINSEHKTHKFGNRNENEIDLTQSSNSSNGKSNCDELTNPVTSNYSNSLGKRDNVSIDYDEIFDDVVRDCKSQTSSHTQHNSLGCDIGNITEKESSNFNDDLASNNLSKSSEGFDISDKELNYSLCEANYENSSFRDIPINHHSRTENKLFSESNLSKQSINSPNKYVSQFKKLNYNSEVSPVRVHKENIENVIQTPKDGEYIIKTNNVTPMLDYASMSSPERQKELEKFGLKPFKRKRAIQLLTYLYNQTHPVVDSHVDDCPSPSKRQKTGNEGKILNTPQMASRSSRSPLDSIPAINKVNDLYAVTKEQPDIGNIECDVEDWFFQKREKAKVHSSRVPLHIAFHNYISCRQRLREAILRYEPVNIDIIHKDLVASGYRYNPKDLLKFMDKKCITVKTADNTSRNRKL